MTMLIANWRLCRAVLTPALALLAMAAAPGRADDFYKGKQINFIVSSDVGGSYDGFARMLARHLPKYIPGEPTVVVQNMAGAGGLRATNWLYNVAPKDGLTIGMIQNTLAFDPLYGNKQAQFDAAKFNWLGSPSQETGLLILWHTVPVDSLEQMKTREVVLGASGSGSTPAFFARVLASVFDLKIKLIPGYRSQTDSFLAMQRLENDGNASPFWSSLMAENASWISEKKIKVMTYYGKQKNPDIPGPYVFDLIQGDDKKAIMELAQAGLVMGRPMVMPPGADPAKVAIVRTALESVFKDATYIEECRKQRLDCSQPSTGPQLLEHVTRIYASPTAAVEKIRAIYQEGQKS